MIRTHIEQPKRILLRNAVDASMTHVQSLYIDVFHGLLKRSDDLNEVGRVGPIDVMKRDVLGEKIAQ